MILKDKIAAQLPSGAADEGVVSEAIKTSKWARAGDGQVNGGMRDVRGLVTEIFPMSIKRRHPPARTIPSQSCSRLLPKPAGAKCSGRGCVLLTR